MNKKQQRFILILIITLTLFLGIYKNNIFAATDKNNILILASYSPDNEWESDVLEGIKNNKLDAYSYQVEYLDSKSINYNSYKDNFNNLINAKYKDVNFDIVITIDDEAFDFARELIFDANSILFSKKIVFCGVNQQLDLTNYEKENVTGILDYQSNLSLINNIININPNLKNIYVLLDTSIYSTTLKYNLIEISDYTHKNIELKYITNTYMSKFKEDLQEIDPNNSAILVCGTYLDDYNQVISSKEVINFIKDNTSAQIYSKLDQYICNGAIGGIINDGVKLGELTSTLSKKFISTNYTYLQPTFSNFNISLFNYEAIKRYNINPFKLPPNSIYINKGPLDFLLPKSLRYLSWICIVIFIFSIIFIIYLTYINRKRVRIKSMLLKESIERSNIRTDFILTISHELRTPLNIIMNSSNLLKIKVLEDNFDKEYFLKQTSYITKNSKRLLRLVNNLIDVNKIESGDMEVNYTLENIVEVVEDTTLSIVDLAERRNIKVVFDTDEEEIITSIDKEKIERIMLNLLSNSIKFSNENGFIHVNVTHNNNYVNIEVIDDGKGMSENLKSHLFEKFKREDSSTSLIREQEGSGLGLFIVNGLIRLHNGRIDVTSSLGKGSTFKITLPIVKNISNNDSNIAHNSFKLLSQLELSDIKDDN